MIIALLGAGCSVPSGTVKTTPGNTIPDLGTNKPRYKEIVNPAGFVNAENVNIGELVGKKVILLDFVTYSCINCIRTFPYLKAWHEKYKDQGLEIIGIHTPEFAFEKKKENVEMAMKKYGLTFPIVLDNDYGTWRAYGNNYWPRKYLIDIHGNIIYDHIGEGGYDETERKIQEALKERAEFLGEEMAVDGGMSKPTGTDSVASGVKLSPEVYFGSERNEYLENGNKSVNGIQAFIAPKDIRKESLYLVGQWDITPESAKNPDQTGKIIFKYSARKVNIVARSDVPVRMKVLLDGKNIGAAAGADVVNGFVTIQADQLYELVDDKSGYGEHTLELQSEKTGVETGVEVFTFTFG